MNILQIYLLRAPAMSVVMTLAFALFTGCSTANQPSVPVAESVASTPTGIVEQLPTPTPAPAITPLAGDTPTAIAVTPEPDETWITESYGDAWTIGFPAGWMVNDAGAHEGALTVEGSYEGRSYAVTYSYPIGILAASLEAWVEEALLPLSLEQRNGVTVTDITVANTPAKKVLQVPTPDGASLAHHVYIWRSDSKNPRLITIAPTDSQPVDAVAMDQLLDRLLATVQ
jgi:hypothetical protein